MSPTSNLDDPYQQGSTPKDFVNEHKPVTEQRLHFPMGFNVVDSNAFTGVLRQMIESLDPDMAISVHKSQDNFDYVITAHKTVRSKRFTSTCTVSIQEMAIVSDFNKFIFENGIKPLYRELDSLIQKELAPKITTLTELVEDEMAKKIRIAKTPKRVIDPKKIKKPFCPIHRETQMEYDQVRGKWACKTSGCNQVATPKAAPEDNAVTFGKGQIQLRLMYTDDKLPHVILLADNNVALEITDMVDVVALEDEFAVRDTAKLANGNSRREFHIPTAQKIPLHASLYVMGTDNIE